MAFFSKSSEAVQLVLIQTVGLRPYPEGGYGAFEEFGECFEVDPGFVFWKEVRAADYWKR